MIEDAEKSIALVERIRDALPLRAFTTLELRRTLKQNSKREFPRECGVTEVSYLGDEGGILCGLDFGLNDTENAHFVSITHLGFKRGHPLAREIEAYCKHRIKRLKKLHRGGPALDVR